MQTSQSPWVSFKCEGGLEREKVILKKGEGRSKGRRKGKMKEQKKRLGEVEDTNKDFMFGSGFFFRGRLWFLVYCMHNPLLSFVPH